MAPSGVCASRAALAVLLARPAPQYHGLPASNYLINFTNLVISVVKGFNPKAEMPLRWFRRDREGFEKAYHQRSLIEPAFSSMKERVGFVVAAKTLPMQRLQIILRSICYDLMA